jgi:hypothetical protein
VAGDYLGVARTDPAGRLYRIDLNTDAARLPEVVVHEVTHAWVSEGPVALVEGTAELIADCIVDRDPGLAPHQYDDGRDLSGLPDLLTWTKPQEGTPTELHAVRTDAYVGSARLLRTALLAVPGPTLWSDRKVEWNEFEAALLAAGPRGRALVDVLEAGAAAQRAALQDADRDGLTALAESWLGTDDARYDTDGDGWADPAVLGVPAGALSVPLDATPICTNAAELPALLGTLRGPALPGLVARRVPGDGARPLLVRLSRSPGIDTTGAAWVVARGGATRGCRSTARTTVWAEDPALDGRVATFSGALQDAVAEAEARYGPGPDRVAVALGGAHTEVEGDVVFLSTADVQSTDPVALARVAVAVRRLWLDGERDWSAAEAVARGLVD